MALEQHNTAFEFETMLRTHLSRGGSMVEACAGFDADTASAYLEDALGQQARSHYDAHLAGCPSCRRSIIELSRLIQIEPQITPITAPATVGSNWKSVVAGWFDLSGWNLAARNWGLATAGVAGAVLVTIMATQAWRQPTSQVNVATAPTAEAASGGQSSAGLAASQPTGEMTASSNEEAQKQAGISTLSPVPTPMQIGPAQNDQNVASVFSSKLDAEASKNLVATAQPVASSSVGESLPPAPAPKVQPVIANLSTVGQLGAAFTPLVESDQVAGKPEAPAAVQNARIIAPINPSPNDNPMKRGAKASPPSNIFDGAFSFAPRKQQAERKLEPKDLEPDAPKVLTVRVRDKVFSFQGGMWVDHTYKPEMAWRITKLVQDSDEYKKTLAEDPQLKEFFERGTVIVVWKDKVYKVVAK